MTSTFAQLFRSSPVFAAAEILSRSPLFTASQILARSPMGQAANIWSMPALAARLDVSALRERNNQTMLLLANAFNSKERNAYDSR